MPIVPCLIDQAVPFSALFAIWFPHFRYHRLIATLGRSEGRHFTDNISLWNLVLHDQPSYHSLIWHVRPINLEMLCQTQIFAECNNSRGNWLYSIVFAHVFASFCYVMFSYPDIDCVLLQLLHVCSVSLELIGCSAHFVWGASKFIMKCLKVHSFFFFFILFDLIIFRMVPVNWSCF